MSLWGCKANKGTANVQSVLLICAAAASPRRGKLCEYTLGCGATPADAAYIHVIQRCTTAGTGTTLTPNALDPSDPIATIMVVKDTVTADPTLTANAFLSRKALHQKATLHWKAAPGRELWIPATASNGLMLGLSAATTTDFDYDAIFEEV